MHNSSRRGRSSARWRLWRRQLARMFCHQRRIVQNSAWWPILSAPPFRPSEFVSCPHLSIRIIIFRLQASVARIPVCHAFRFLRIPVPVTHIFVDCDPHHYLSLASFSCSESLVPMHTCTAEPMHDPICLVCFYVGAVATASHIWLIAANARPLFFSLVRRDFPFFFVVQVQLLACWFYTRRLSRSVSLALFCCVAFEYLNTCSCRNLLELS